MDVESYQWHDKTPMEYLELLRPLAYAGMGRDLCSQEENALREWADRQGDDDRDDLLVILENKIPIQVFWAMGPRCLVVPVPWRDAS